MGCLIALCEDDNAFVDFEVTVDAGRTEGLLVSERSRLALRRGEERRGVAVVEGADAHMFSSLSIRGLAWVIWGRRNLGQKILQMKVYSIQ